MRISRVRLKGFRNFKNAVINFSQKSLIIGCNDIGKSNLLYALRIILDRSLSEVDIEARDSDFYVHEQTNEIEIVVEFEDIQENCVLARLGGKCSDDGKTVIVYRVVRDVATKRIESPQFLAGKSIDFLEPIMGRSLYLKVMNLKYIGSKRDLVAFVRRERRNLLQDARQRRTENEITNDDIMLDEINSYLNNASKGIKNLSYVNRATETLNAELVNLSYHHIAQEVVFDVGTTDANQIVDDLHLTSKINGKNLIVGGDGRNSQIHLALWSARNNVFTDSGDEPLEVNIFCIEEPETHLHPHQQRRLAKYLAETLNTQVIITTHSPQITCEFSPSSIIHLYNNGPDTKAAGDGCNPHITDSIIDFGYRLNIIPAEAFFSTLVFLVEGPSEELFYKALACEIGIELDRYNISILGVDGVGFKPYTALLSALNIPYVVRTDNDIFRHTTKEEYRFAGIIRAISICRLSLERDQEGIALLSLEEKLKGFSTKTPPHENLTVADSFTRCLKRFNIFLAEKDLEHDIQAALPNETASFFGVSSDEEIVRQMQKAKAQNMFRFLQKHSSSLKRLSESALAEPLKRCKKIIEMTYVTTDTRTASNN
jgi:putative ATP-dependent endonuclease of the OLD family